MLRNLLVNLQIEQEAGQAVGHGVHGPSQARQSRVKFEKTAELVMSLIQEMEGK